MKTHKISLKNLVRGLYDQLPIKRFFTNFIVTRNAWGLFHINSHVNQISKKLKVAYSTRESALKAAGAMARKNKCHYSTYKCVYCDGYHIGRNRSVMEK